jgi:hypothetical protein
MKPEDGVSRAEGPPSEEDATEREEVSRLSATRLEVAALWAMLGGKPPPKKRDDDPQPPDA